MLGEGKARMGPSRVTRLGASVVLSLVISAGLTAMALGAAPTGPTQSPSVGPTMAANASPPPMVSSSPTVTPSFHAPATDPTADLGAGGACPTPELSQPVTLPGCAPQPSSSAATRQANASPAAATGDPSIKGTVTGPDGKPLADIDVEAYAPSAPNDGGDTRTASDGTYSVAVPAGSYIMGFSDQSGVYLGGWYSSSASGGFTTHSESATPIRVTKSDVTGIDVQLPEVPEIKGTVTGPDGKPLANIEVLASFDFPAPAIFDARATTASDGTYSMTVMPGACIIQVSDPSAAYLTGYYSSTGFTLDIESATLVTVSTSDVTGIDVQMQTGHRISGTVTGPAGTPPAQISVSAHQIDKPTDWYGVDVKTASDGKYSVAVPAGSYSMEFIDSAGDYLAGFYSSSGFTAFEDSATPVTVGKSDVSGIDVQMETGYLISGKITGTGAAPLANVFVAADSPAHSYEARATTAADGTYSITVPASGYTVAYDSGGRYLDGWYSSSASGHFTSDQGSATLVTVTTSDVTGIDVVLPLGATYHAVTPVRVLDSRPGPGHIGATLFRSRVKQTVLVATVASGVPKSAFAVTGNVTVVGQTGAGYVSLAPSLTSGHSPGTSTINFPTGDVRANGVTVALASGGNLDFMYWSGSTANTINLLFDVTGYFSTDQSGATYHTVAPVRVLDSRPGSGHIGATLFHSRASQTVAVATAASGVPTTAIAVTGNVTVVGQTAAGYVSLAASLTSGVVPDGSTINFPKGDTRANGVTVALAPGGKLDLMYWSGNTSDTVNILFDVTGYFSADQSGATYRAFTPYRVLDSRSRFQYNGASLFHSRIKETVTYIGGPSVVAVTGNVTVVGQTAAGYVSLAPSLKSGVAPGTSTINFPAGDTRANGVTVSLASGGSLDFMYWTGNTANTTNIVFDVTGYFIW